jgi:hypothetical protein
MLDLSYLATFPNIPSPNIPQYENNRLSQSRQGRQEEPDLMSCERRSQHTFLARKDPGSTGL